MPPAVNSVAMPLPLVLLLYSVPVAGVWRGRRVGLLRGFLWGLLALVLGYLAFAGVSIALGVLYYAGGGH